MSSVSEIYVPKSLREWVSDPDAQEHIEVTSSADSIRFEVHLTTPYRQAFSKVEVLLLAFDAWGRPISRRRGFADQLEKRAQSMHGPARHSIAWSWTSKRAFTLHRGIAIVARVALNQHDGIVAHEATEDELSTLSRWDLWRVPGAYDELRVIAPESNAQ